MSSGSDRVKHVLITGGSGFVGSHLCDRFLKEGFAVTAVDNFVTGSKQNTAHILGNANFELIDHDVSEPWPLEKFKLLKKHGLWGVLHFACPASPVDFERIPFEILKVDSHGTFHSVDLALKHGARYVLASTSEIYGDPLVHPQTEDYWGNVNSIGPRSCYDETKRYAEALVSSAARGAGQWNGKSYRPLNGGIVRIFNTYGPRMRPNDGRVVPELCMQALRGESMTIHGAGLQTRSFCFITDLVDGIYRYSVSNAHEPVNIGNPIEHSILDFAKIIRKITDSSSDIQHLADRPDDPRRRCPDISRAQKKLDWQPKVPLEAGLRETIEYFKKLL